VTLTRTADDAPGIASITPRRSRVRAGRASPG
jgi:hypothetical protein